MRSMSSQRIPSVAIVVVIQLLVPSMGLSAPCGGIALEGQCDGKTREYCSASTLQTEECTDCCGWDGQRYACLTECPAPGECIDECLEGPDVFGCSLMNTHEWTCVEDASGCIVREYVACAEGYICDESTTSTCRSASDVDQCSGITSAGECKGTIFKQCVDGQLVSTDCGALGQACGPTGCSQCTDECEVGAVGCESVGAAWSCVTSALTGCLERVAKNCSGGKQCWEGECVYELPVRTEAEDTGEAVGVDAESRVDAPIAAASDTGCATSGFAPDSMRDGLLAVISTLLGFLLFIRIARRRN